jgi:hypothetical protein
MLQPIRTLTLSLLAVCALAQTPADRTRQALDLLLARSDQALYELFSPEMKKAVAFDAFSQRFDQIMPTGKPVSIGEPTVRTLPDAALVAISVHWPGASLRFKFSWTLDGKIQGLFFDLLPAGYVNPDQFTERDVTIGDDRWKLPATLTLPKGNGPFPAVVLVHGSGPGDRDETDGGAKPFKDLAQGLATRGVAVLRYEKRTRQYPVPEAAPTMTAETVEDALRAAALLRTLPGISPQSIYVLGHSQGGYMMPRILQRDHRLAGAILLAANARPLQEITVEQIEYLLSLAGGGTPAQRIYLEDLKQDPWIALSNLPQTYRADLLLYNPAAQARTLDTPMLILQGERDYQVTMKDFALWRASLNVRKNATFRSYPNLNHLFIAGQGKSTPAEYERPAHVASEVIADIAAWIQSPQ